MQLARFIDHTILKNTTTIADVDRVCNEAIQYEFAAVCVPSYYVQDAKKLLEGTTVKLATVVGFPFGYQESRVKLFETDIAVKAGADEIDMVINLAAFKSNDLAYLENEIQDISDFTSTFKKTLKVIIETGILGNEEIIKCCELYRHFPIQFLKTSTGYAEKGASVEAVRMMRQHLPEHIQIKASGGIKTAAFAKELIEAGATRLGCSASVAIVSSEESKGGY